MTTGIVVAGVGGFLGWVLVGIGSWLINRSRLHSYLVVVLNVHIDEVRDNQRWLDRFMAKTVGVGARISGAPHYARGDLDDVELVKAQAIQTLWKRETLRLTKCTSALWEIEVLFEGFCARLRELQDSGVTLDEESVDYIERRANRIRTLVGLLPKRIDRIADLPEDYSARIGAEVLVVESTS